LPLVCAIGHGAGERTIAAAEQRALAGIGHAMHRQHRVAVGDQRQGARLVEAGARNVQGFEVHRRQRAFEQVEIEVVAGDCTRHLRSAPLDAPAMRRDDGDPAAASLDGDVVVDALAMRGRQFGIAAMAVAVHVAQGLPDRNSFSMRAMPG
jgi:hypothetical protein